MSEPDPADLCQNFTAEPSGGEGELTVRLRVSAHGFSKSAEAAIKSAGGTVEVLPLPYGTGRPPAKGNQFTNR